LIKVKIFIRGGKGWERAMVVENSQGVVRATSGGVKIGPRAFESGVDAIALPPQSISQQVGQKVGKVG
jgi:hypothetical protein